MKSSRTTLWLGLASALAAFPAPAQETCTERSVCGEVSPLIPMQSTEAVHMGLAWKSDSDAPKIIFHSRFPEYVPNDVADPVRVDAAIAAGGLMNGTMDFNASLRDVLNPGFADGTEPTADSFQRLTYGGLLLRQGLSQSVPTRIVANRTMERQLLFDIGHPDAFKNTGKLHTALLDEADFALNRAAFTEVGYSKGNFYNTYCNARVTLADGKIYVFGGHDMQSQNGLYKVNIFDPDTEQWAPRAEPCTRANWTQDPFGTDLFASDPAAKNYPGCDQLQVTSTQPPDPSDMRYARWYPSAAALPDGTVLVLAGTDSDASVGPDPDAAAKGVQGIPQTDAAFNATRVTQVVPEIYDPATDTNIALENARKTFPLYPQTEVVQTGNGPDDWILCTQGGTATVQNPVPPGGDRFFGPFTGDTWCLDVNAARNDPDRDVPGEKHWTLMASSAINRHYCCPTASLTRTDAAGRTRSHQWLMIGGRDPAAANATVAGIESIEFTDKNPSWKSAGAMLGPRITAKAVTLPTGQVLIGQGTFAQGATYPERAGSQFQLYDPATKTTTGLASTTVVRGLHGTATLLPDATVLFAGENREALIRNDDPAFPLGPFPVPDPDLGVPVGQVFRPPYLFNADGTLATRPVIQSAPANAGYGGNLDFNVAGSSRQIAKVVLIRSDHNTHSYVGGDRFLDLAFNIRNDTTGGLRARLPQGPAQAVPGIYMLFVVDRAGVPSVAKKVVLGGS